MSGMAEDDPMTTRRFVRERLRTPIIVLVVLLTLLGVETLIGATSTTGTWWLAEFGCALTMVALVIVFSMEMFQHQPIVRLFSLLGFFWVGILFSLIMVDYLTRR